MDKKIREQIKNSGVFFVLETIILIATIIEILIAHRINYIILAMFIFVIIIHVFIKANKKCEEKFF